MTKYKKNPNNIYALYQSGSKWCESASIKNDNLNDSGMFKFVENVNDVESQTSFNIYEKLTLPVYCDSLTAVKFLPTWSQCNWSITIDGETRTLKPTVTLTPFELYNITVWKEECLANRHAEPIKFKERAIELGIWGYFTS